LGTYAMTPGQNHRVVLANQVGGTVVADAIKFQAAGSGTPRRATWGLPVTTTGTYNVYARWAADAANATNASYTVHYAGGTTVVPMNQTQNGGQWNLLGTFTLNPASNPMVELSDQANGRVVADAVMVVPSGVSTDHVTYTPTLTTAGTVNIYAKWTENATRAQAVAYTVQHAGGATDMVVNQQQPSAGWFRLGAFSMAPGQNHGVEVRGALEGVTVADAVRFVSAGTSAPGIQYVHADHLGSPQKMTDASKAVVWDAVFTPFGQVHSITGTATNNQRFPGPYADAETGYFYNHFRDYDPTTGRYIQSDPIKLRGGLNTYRYVGGNLLYWIDPLGLAVEFCRAPADIAYGCVDHD
jgi:RHS repeat-associated protein